MVTLGKADLILVNGQFHTVDRENPVAEAVAVRDGKFLEVGTVAEVMQQAPPGGCRGSRPVRTMLSRPLRSARWVQVVHAASLESGRPPG